MVRRSWLVVVALVAALCVPLRAQVGVGFAHQHNLGVTNAGITQLTVPQGTTYCVISVATNPVNWVDDATAPVVTVSTGIPASAGSIITFAGFLNCTNFRVIAQAGSAQLNIQYYR